MLTRRRFVSTVGSAGVAATAGCLGGVGERVAGSDPLPDTLHIGVPSPTEPVYSFPLYGQLQRELTDRGVTLKRTFFQGFTPMVAGLVRGDVDIGYLTISAAVRAISSGFPVTSPASYLNEYVFVMAVASDVEAWDDLQGKRVATHSPQSMSTAVGMTMVDQELGGADQVEFVNILGATNRLAAIQSGNVSAAIVPLSAGLNAESEGYARVLARPWEYEPLRTQTAATWIVLEDQLDSDESMYGEIHSLLASSYQHVYEADISSFTEQALELGGSVFPDYGQEIWERSFEEVRGIDTWPRDATLTAEQLTRAQATMVSSGMLPEEEQIEAGRLMDDRFW